MTDVTVVRGGSQRSASTIELFFDLVYVYAITQVAGLMRAEPNLVGLARGAFILLMLWWTWSIYTWTTNWLGTAGAGVRLALIGAMGMTLLLAKTVPEAFGDAAIWFGSTYFAVRMVAAALYWMGARDDPGQRAALLTFLPLSILGATLVLAGGLLEPPLLVWFWVAAVVVDMASAAAAGRGTWALDAHHFAERNGLFVIIALGESVVAMGLAAAGGEHRAVHLVSLVAAFAGAAALWWAYFDRAAPAAEAYLERATAQERGRFARDYYTILHYPIVGGIVMYAVAAEEVIAHPEEALTMAARVSLALGAALMLLAIVVGTWRAVRRILTERVAAIGALAVIVVVGGRMAAWGFTLAVAAILALALALERSHGWPESAARRTAPVGGDP